MFKIDVKSQGFNYKTENSSKWNSTGKFCIVAKCTETNGGDCTTPGSAPRICIDLANIPGKRKYGKIKHEDELLYN
ncbi:MAG: hypothetical protein ACJAS3_002292 [Roseivirga sp.]|jgi:hypothetical protein